jgi:hypothetical protein
MESGKGFQASVQDPHERRQEPISSLREIYDQWVEMSEAAYAEFVMTEEYQSAVRSLGKQSAGAQTADGAHRRSDLEAMHMPTHAEISTLAAPSTGVASRQPKTSQGAEGCAAADLKQCGKRSVAVSCRRQNQVGQSAGAKAAPAAKAPRLQRQGSSQTLPPRPPRKPPPSPPPKK